MMSVGKSAKKVPADKIPRINNVEKGNEKAKTNTASSASNVRRSLGKPEASSRKLNAEMCAKGQKLAELKGIATANSTMVGSFMPSTAITAALNSMVIPALNISIELINLFFFCFS